MCYFCVFMGDLGHGAGSGVSEWSGISDAVLYAIDALLPDAGLYAATGLLPATRVLCPTGLLSSTCLLYATGILSTTSVCSVCLLPCAGGVGASKVLRRGATCA